MASARSHTCWPRSRPIPPTLPADAGSAHDHTRYTRRSDRGWSPPAVSSTSDSAGSLHPALPGWLGGRRVSRCALLTLPLEIDPCQLQLGSSVRVERLSQFGRVTTNDAPIWLTVSARSTDPQHAAVGAPTSFQLARNRIIVDSPAMRHRVSVRRACDPHTRPLVNPSHRAHRTTNRPSSALGDTTQWALAEQRPTSSCRYVPQRAGTSRPSNTGTARTIPTSTPVAC